MRVSSCSSKSCELARLIMYLARAVSTSLPMSCKGQALITSSSLSLGMPAAPALPLGCKFMSKKIWSWGQATRSTAEPPQSLTQRLPARHLCPERRQGQPTEHKDVEWFIAGEAKLLQIYTYMALVWLQKKKKIVQNYFSEQGFSRQSFPVLNHRVIKLRPRESSEEWARWWQPLPERGSSRARDATGCSHRAGQEQPCPHVPPLKGFSLDVPLYRCLRFYSQKQDSWFFRSSFISDNGISYPKISKGDCDSISNILSGKI